MQDRYDAFKVNYLKIEAHNALDAPFKLGVNEFTDMTEEEFIADRFGARLPDRLKQKRLQSARTSELRKRQVV